MAGGISFDRVASLYDATRAVPPGVEGAVADQLARLLAGQRTLEIGVGTGRWARPLESRGVDLFGVDLSPAMLRVARTKGFRGGILGDVLRLPLRDKSFDAVLSNHVLHLVFDVPGVLDEIARVTTGRLRSVVEYEVSRPDIMGVYRELIEQRGSPQHPPGLGERDLVKRLPPDRTREITTVHVRASSRATLVALGARAFRDTWAVPQEVHDRVLGDLRTRFAESEIVSETRVEIVEWDHERLSGFAADWRQSQPSVAGSRQNPGPP
ncbi:MAG: class I SAM-dependent methyltransferase [Thermoplasmata archaeon]|nr:class I SAM-dependent methyltransferase [Thermoplasmata archaeon]